MYGFIVVFQHATSSNPFIYGKNNFHSPTNLVVVNLALSDATSIYALVAMAGYHLSLLKQKALDVVDWKVKDDVRKCLSEAWYHLFEAVRLLNEQFQKVKEALSITSMISVAMLGACTV